MKHWFIADQHFYHHNIIRFCDRPFSNVKQMNTILIDNHNSIVGDNDKVWHLGDIMYWKGYSEAQNKGTSLTKLRRIMSRLRGKHELILGNHDTFTPRQYIEIGFSAVHTSLSINIDGTLVLLNHDPCIGSGIKEGIFVCGHTHGLFKSMLNEDKDCVPCVNVSVENWNYTPVSFGQILEEIRK